MDKTIELLGDSLRETLYTLYPNSDWIRRKLTVHEPKLREGTRRREAQNKTKVIVRIIITFVLLAVAIYLEINPNADSKSVPATIFGVVAGYWLK